MILLIIAIILFFLIDLLIRNFLKKSEEKKIRRERESILNTGLRLDFSHEAKSLKRVEQDNPKARILCVDDEEVILDSFRKILVIEGYSVDTVSNGKEALGLLQTHHYDFVFTDLKMPDMDGIAVTKAAKHMRPDIDVIIITGYATIESAVETMSFGAMDYVQKPFTEDELLDFTRKCLIKRRDRIRKELKPKVHITNLPEFSKNEIGEFSIQGGVFISSGHCWVSIIQDGTARIGIDDFAKKVIGKIDAIELPNLGRAISCGDPIFSVKQGTRSIPFISPVSGKVISVNTDLNAKPDALDLTPYANNWFCTLDADNLSEEVKNLMIGIATVAFYQDEIEKSISYFKPYMEALKSGTELTQHVGHFWGQLEKLDNKTVEKIINTFFKRI